MNDGRSYPDNASASSDDSIKIPPPLENSRVKPGPGALPPNAFDPLKHDEWEVFWYTIDQHFQPINQDHIQNLKQIPLNPYGGLRDRALRLGISQEDDSADAKISIAERKAEEERERKRERQLELEKEKEREKEKEKNRKRDSKRENKKDKAISSSLKLDDPKKTLVNEKDLLSVDSKDEDAILNAKSNSTTSTTASKSSPNMETNESRHIATLNSFPFTQRLFAAFLDTNGLDGTPAPQSNQSRNNRPSHYPEDNLWLGAGTDTEREDYQNAFEDRVKSQLKEMGLVDNIEHDVLENQIRQDQWKLREIKIVNRIRKTSLYTLIMSTELRSQAFRREVKRHNDSVELAYLERLVRNMKKNKKSRSKYQKMIQKLFGHYKEKEKHTEKMRKAIESANQGKMLTNGDEKPKGSSTKKKRKKIETKGPPQTVGSSSVMSKY